MKKERLLGVEIGQLRKDEVWIFLEKVFQKRNKEQSSKLGKNALLKEFNEKKLFLVTLNPEIILKTCQDPFYLKVINSADIKINDGIGIKLGAFLRRISCGERITGVELADFLLKKASELNLKVTIIYSQSGLSQKSEIEKYLIQRRIRNFEVLGFCFPINSKNNEEVILKKMNKKTDIILVGLGAPWQEKIIFQLKKMKYDFVVAVGVGGTFDFWTQKQLRAPLFLRKIGLEWSWRLLMQPRQRLKRIWNATIVFIWRVIFKNNFYFFY